MKLLEGQWRECGRGISRHMGPIPQNINIAIWMILTLGTDFFTVLIDIIYIVLHGAVMPQCALAHGALK